MPRGTKLDATEMKLIEQLHKDGQSISAIARTLKRSRKVIRNYLQKPAQYKRKNPGGRLAAVTDREKRAILRMASNSLTTAREIAEAAGVRTHVRNVQRILHNAEHLRRHKLKRKPPLTQRHKNAHLAFATAHVRGRKGGRK